MPAKKKSPEGVATSKGKGDRKPNLYKIVGSATIYSEWMQLGQSYEVRFVYDGERNFSLSWRPSRPINRAARRLILARYSEARDNFLIALVEKVGGKAARFFDYGTGEGGIIV